MGVVESPALEVLQKHVDVAPGHMVDLSVLEEHLDLMILKGFSNLNKFQILWSALVVYEKFSFPIKTALDSAVGHTTEKKNP